MKLCLGFYQVVTRVPDVFKLSFPRAAERLLAVFEVFNINVSGLSVPIACVGLGSYSNKMLFTILFPFVIAAVIAFGSVGYAVLSARMAATPETDRKSRTSAATESDRKSPFKDGRLLALPYLLILSFLVFPMVSCTAFRAFDCEEFDDGKTYLRADFAVECWSSAQHESAVALALIGILLYPVGVSLLYIVLLRIAEKAILEERPTALSTALGFLTLDFDKSYFWWELVEAWKKLFLVGFCVLIVPGSILQLMIAFVFSLLCMLATAVASPFLSDVDDSVAKALGFALTAVFFFALVLKVVAATDSLGDQLGVQLEREFKVDFVIISASMTIAVALALAVTVFMAMQQLVRAARTPVIKLKSTHRRPALTEDSGMSWHLFLSQCASRLELRASPRPKHDLTSDPVDPCLQYLEHWTGSVRDHQAAAHAVASGRLHLSRRGCSPICGSTPQLAELLLTCD